MVKPILSPESIEKLLAHQGMLLNDLRDITPEDATAVRAARRQGSRYEYLVWWSSGEVSHLGFQLVSVLLKDPHYRSGHRAILAVSLGVDK
jgi:hypothetical protein